MKSYQFLFAGVLVVIAGCSSSEPAPGPGSTAGAPANSQYVADVEPAGAVPVGEARKSVTDEQMVTLIGKIGGSAEPFVDGLAAFTIVDPKVPHCSPEEGCPTPWDYCCTQDEVKDNIATVKVVDESGSPVADDARKLLGVQELSTVVVQGQARKDDQGNLTIAATKVFVRTGE